MTSKIVCIFLVIWVLMSSATWTQQSDDQDVFEDLFSHVQEFAENVIAAVNNKLAQRAEFEEAEDDYDDELSDGLVP